MTTPAPLAVTLGVEAVVDEAFPRAAWAATGLVVATPDHSETLAEAAALAESVAVTRVMPAGAPTRNQSSTRVFEPVRNPTGPFVQAPPVESATAVTDLELPVAIAIDATNALPAADALTGTASDVPLVMLAVA
jgi:hypothetical protein